MSVGYWIGRALTAKIPGFTFSVMHLVSMVIVIAITIAILLPFVVGILEVRHWFFTASWDGYSVRELTIEYLCPWPEPYAKGFAKILDWFGTWPGWLGLAVVEYGGVFLVWWAHISDSKNY